MPTHAMTRVRVEKALLSGLVLAVILALGARQSAASGCLDGVERMAENHALTIDPPDAATGPNQPGLTASELAESGGVVEPPLSDGPAVIEPPALGESRMPTMPDVSPSRPTVAAGLSAGERATLESILMAARAEARQGNEIDCFQRLQAAQSFVAERQG